MKSLILAFLFLIGHFVVDVSIDEYRDQSFPTSYVELYGTTDSNLLYVLSRWDNVVITQGNGGLVYGMVLTLAYLRDNPQKHIIIDGKCFSACTMLLSATRNVSLTPRAQMFFHSAAREECYEGSVRRVLAPRGNATMMGRFNVPTRLWLKTVHAFRSLEFTRMPTLMLRSLYPSMMVSGVRASSPLMVIDATFEKSKTKPKPLVCPFVPPINPN